MEDRGFGSLDTRPNRINPKLRFPGVLSGSGAGIRLGYNDGWWLAGAAGDGSWRLRRGP
jgi:hypothetical protein